MSSVRRSPRISKVHFELQKCNTVDKIYNYTLKVLPSVVTDEFITILNQFGTFLLSNHISSTICRGHKKFIVTLESVVPNTFFTRTDYTSDDGITIPIPMTTFETAWNMFCYIRSYLHPHITAYNTLTTKVRKSITVTACLEDCECDICQLVNMTVQNLFVDPSAATQATATSDTSGDTNSGASGGGSTGGSASSAMDVE